MLLKLLASELGYRLLNTAIAAIVISIVCVASYFLFRKRTPALRQRQRIKYRIAYVGMLVFLLVMVRIWVEGFTHIFAMLSLIAAGIVVTNKENIMNIAGWLIINWRGVFSEGDYIKIQDVSGYVESVKLLSFKVIETQALGEARATGRTVKVPNGLIIIHPVFIFPSEDTLMLQNIEYEVPMSAEGLAMAANAERHIKGIIESWYGADAHYSSKSLRKNNRALSDLMDLEPRVQVKVISSDAAKMLLTISFYCYPKDRAGIEKALLELRLSDSGSAGIQD